MGEIGTKQAEKSDSKCTESPVVIGRAKQAPHCWGVQSRFLVIQYIYVSLYVHRMSKCVGGITRSKHAHVQNQFWAVKPTCDTRIIHFFYTESSFSVDEKQNQKVHLEMRNLKQTNFQRWKNRGKKADYKMRKR